ncbi:MAG: zinc-binding dehydrogenase [Clostridia bacterium]
MKTKAVRLYGKNDLRLETFDLKEIKEDEILAHIISDSICMSTYKATLMGSEHKRVPINIKTSPIIIGHEFCGEIVKVGKKWQGEFKKGDKFAIQPAVNYKGKLDAPGYSYANIGGASTYCIIPNEIMESGCLLKYNGSAFFYGSLCEPLSCIIGGFNASYHTTLGSYTHKMGIKKGGNLAILAGGGAMGLAATSLAINSENAPLLIVVTDIDKERLKRASSILPVKRATKKGIKLVYLDVSDSKNIASHLLKLTNGKGFDDVFVYTPIKSVVELADEILAVDGCLNFFAGPTNANFKAELNFYNVHYNAVHIVGTSGGNTKDMKKALSLIEKGELNPSNMITHIGGLDAVIDTTLKLPLIGGGKKLIYTNIKMPLIAVEEFKKRENESELYKKLAKIISENGGVWSEKAEKYLLENAEAI